MQAARAVARVADGPVLQDVDAHLDVPGRPDRLEAALVELDALGVHDHLDVRRRVQLAQLLRGELDLRRATAREQVHVGDRAGLERLVDVVRDLGDEQLVGGLGEDPGHVDGDVAGADHGDLGGLQRPLPRHVGVAVVPGGEVRGAVAAVQVDARDVQRRGPSRPRSR